MNKNLRIYCICVFMARIVRVGSNSSSSSSSDNEQNSGRYTFHYQGQYLSSAQTSSTGPGRENGSVQESSAGLGRENGGNPRRVYQASNSNNPPFQNFVPSSRRMTPEQQSNTPNHDNHASIISIFSQIEGNVKSAISANENSKIPYDQLYGIDYCKVIIRKYRNEIFKGFSDTDFANCVYDLALILIAREKKMYDVILGNHQINGRNVCDEIMHNGFLRFKLMTAIERNLMGLSEYTYQFPDVQKALEEYTTIKVLVSLIPDFMVLAKKVYSFYYQQDILLKNLMAKFEADKLDYKVRYHTVAKTYVDSLAGHMTPDRIGHINQSPEEIDKIHANVSALCYMVHHYILKKEQFDKQSVVEEVKNKFSIEKVTVLTKRSIDKKPSKLGKVHYETQFYH